MKHTGYIEAYDGSTSKLVEDIGDLKYDALANFLELLSMKLLRDSKADLRRNRPQLAEKLMRCSEHLDQASQDIEEAWKISKPYMVDKNV